MPVRSASHMITKQSVETFLDGIPELSQVLESHSLLVAHFAYFLESELGEGDVAPRKIRECYDAAVIPAPANIADIMRKSHMFVETSAGTKLNRETRNRIEASLKPREGAHQAIATKSSEDSQSRARSVVVVHGRDTKLRNSMFDLLRSVGLAPIEWAEAVRKTGRGTPYTGEVVDALFSNAQAVIVVLSPDDFVTIRSDLQHQDSTEDSGFQPRPNVFIETGMALAKDETHTVLVQIGQIRQASDLFGRNVVLFDGSPTRRHELIERLKTAGCAVTTTGSDWLRTGDFSLPSDMSPPRRRRKI